MNSEPDFYIQSMADEIGAVVDSYCPDHSVHEVMFTLAALLGAYIAAQRNVTGNDYGPPVRKTLDQIEINNRMMRGRLQ